MIPLPFPHKHYLRFVLNKAGRYGGLRADHRHFHAWRKLKVTNLDAAYPILAALDFIGNKQAFGFWHDFAYLSQFKGHAATR